MVVIGIPQTNDATIRKLSPGIVVRNLSTRILVMKLPTTMVVRK